MRIVHLILTSSFAGSERHAIELANAQSLKHDVTLILRNAAKSGPYAYAHRVDPRVNINYVGDWFARWHARKLVRALRPDVAHAHLSSASRALQGLKGLCLRLATLHIRYKPQQHQDLDALIAIAPWQMEAIPQPLRGHTTQIDNWTLPNAPAEDARKRLRELHGIAAEACVFGAVGRAERNKGFDVLIRAFEKAKLPNAYLVIVGQGVELDALRRQTTSANVILTGFVDRPQDWLAAFDCFVSAARDEPFGLVLLEAMKAGLPIMASETKGARHLMDVMGSALLPIEDIGALAAELVNFEKLRPGRKNYDMQRFDISEKLAEIEAFYAAELAKITIKPST